MKKAVPVRMPPWSEEDLPTSKQVEVYILFWERQRKPWASDPGAGFLQKSFWLDPEELDTDAHEAECFRAGRPDRALFIRRLLATYHQRKTRKPVARPMPIPTSAPPQPANNALSTGLIATAGQVLQRVSTPNAIRERDLTPAEVNEISRMRGLGMSWQPGNVYRVGKTADGRSCLVQFDSQRRELARYGLW